MANYIDRDELLKNEAYFADRDFINSKYDDTLRDIVMRQPVIEQKHGHWKSKKHCTYICSNCGFDYFDDILKEHTKAELSNISKYCPVCGAKMEGVEYYE